MKKSLLPNHSSLWLVTFLLVIYLSIQHETSALGMDVKCTVYRDSDDVNGDNVDVRIFLLGLKPNVEYTAHVIPDHDQPSSVTTKTDYEGIFWSVAKIPNGDKSLSFKVDIYEGGNTNGDIVATGDDDAPCYEIDIDN